MHEQTIFMHERRFFMHACSFQLHVIIQLMFGQKVGMKNLYHVLQDDVGVDDARFEKIVAAARARARSVVVCPSFPKGFDVRQSFVYR